jgi:hypothetical protein
LGSLRLGSKDVNTRKEAPFLVQSNRSATIILAAWVTRRGFLPCDLLSACIAFAFLLPVHNIMLTLGSLRLGSKDVNTRKEAPFLVQSNRSATIYSCSYWILAAWVTRRGFLPCDLLSACIAFAFLLPVHNTMFSQTAQLLFTAAVIGHQAQTNKTWYYEQEAKKRTFCFLFIIPCFVGLRLVTNNCSCK